MPNKANCLWERGMFGLRPATDILDWQRFVPFHRANK